MYIKRDWTLFSYVITHDTGFAPNPFGGICTLATCKPVIRRNAEIGDWIVGFSSTGMELEDASKRIIYVMEVTDKRTLQDYDKFCLKDNRIKIPKERPKLYENLVGDCIYEYADSDSPKQRKGCHDEGNITTDLNGKYALLSNRFYYFGAKAPLIPERYENIIKNGPGHKSKSNSSYKEGLVNWVTREFEENKIYGRPVDEVDFWKDKQVLIRCSKIDKDGDEKDEKMGGIGC